MFQANETLESESTRPDSTKPDADKALFEDIPHPVKSRFVPPLAVQLQTSAQVQSQTPTEIRASTDARVNIYPEPDVEEPLKEVVLQSTKSDDLFNKPNKKHEQPKQHPK